MWFSIISGCYFYPVSNQSTLKSRNSPKMASVTKKEDNSEESMLLGATLPDRHSEILYTDKSVGT